MSIVRDNLMNQEGYAPYCGNDKCTKMAFEGRTHFTGSQFKCDRCGWESQFEDEFIKQYKEKWGKEP